MRTKSARQRRMLGNISLPSRKTGAVTMRTVKRFAVEDVQYFLLSIVRHPMNPHAASVLNPIFIRAQLAKGSFVPVGEDELGILVTERISLPGSPRIFALGGDCRFFASFIQTEHGIGVLGKVAAMAGQFEGYTLFLATRRF